ncbi:hypothetical protein ACP70R_029439 [Stipagrostis hirtigluma subsp. patula]
MMMNNRSAVCSTPDAALVASFTVSSDLRATEKMMVTTSVLMTVLGAALFALGVLGRFSGPRRAHSTPTRIFFRAAFALFLPFMSYMFSQAKAKHVAARQELILLWMLLVELLRKKVYDMVAPASHAFAHGVGRYTFFDAVEQAARMVWIGYLVYAYVHRPGVKSFFVILWIFSVAKLCKRVYCIERAKSSYDVGKNAGLVAGYMAQLVQAGRQHDVAVGAGSASRVNFLRTCNYAVMGEGGMSRDKTRSGYKLRHIDRILVSSSTNLPPPGHGDGGDDDTEKKTKTKKHHEQLVRVCTIWELAERDPLFRYNARLRRKLEDVCLGLALFKLLRRTFERCPAAEAGTAQARELVFRGLLELDGGGEAEDAERAFEVTELEMTFLMEYYQAVIPVALPKPRLFFANFAFSMAFILLYCVTVLLITGNGSMFRVLASLFHGLASLSVNMAVQFKCFVHQVRFLVAMVCASSDLVVTFLLTLTLFAVETYEFALYMLSDWYLASLLCNYARSAALRVRRPVQCIIRFTLWVKVRTRPQIKVHQVQLLKLQPRRVWVLLSTLLKKRLVGLPRAVVTTEAKVAVVRALKLAGDDDRFSNGERALRRHGYGHLAWACSPETCEVETEAILVWHMATSLFETRDRPEGRRELPPEGRAAVTLSRYCAYLVAYTPGLLPDASAYVEKVYRATKRDLFTLFQSCNTGKRRRERLLQMLPPDGETEKETSAMRSGAMLGKQLEDGVTTMEDEERVWRMLLDFWAELLVSVARAPSGGADAHALALAHGGEFITNVWAILTHAGVDMSPRKGEQTNSNSWGNQHRPRV